MRTIERGAADGLGILAVIAIILVVIVCMAKCGANVSGTSHEEAEKSARQYAKELGIDVRAINCAGIDSDGDGYVSCTIATKTDKLLGIECAGAFTINSGCRIPKFRAGGGS